MSGEDDRMKMMLVYESGMGKWSVGWKSEDDVDRCDGDTECTCGCGCGCEVVF